MRPDTVLRVAATFGIMPAATSNLCPAISSVSVRPLHARAPTMSSIGKAPGKKVRWFFK